MEKEIYAAIMASTSDVDMMTNDRIEALTKGHGMLNIAVTCVANTIAEEVLRGTSIMLTDHNVQRLPVDAVLAMKVLISTHGDIEKAADQIKGIKDKFWLEPEYAKIATNTIARKSEQVQRGPVTKAMILATDGARAKAVHDRARFTYDQLKQGKSLQEVAKRAVRIAAEL